MEEIFLLVSLLLRKGGFSSLSSAVEVVCPFYTKECFVSGLSFCLSRDIKSIREACGVGETLFCLFGLEFLLHANQLSRSLAFTN